MCVVSLSASSVKLVLRIIHPTCSEQKKEWRARLRQAKRNKDLVDMEHLEQELQYSIEKLRKDKIKAAKLKRGYHQGN